MGIGSLAGGLHVVICGLLPAGVVWKSSVRIDQHHRQRVLGRKRAHHCYRQYATPRKKVVCAERNGICAKQNSPQLEAKAKQHAYVEEIAGCQQ